MPDEAASPDPSKSSAEEIRAALTESGGTEAGLDLGESPETSSTHLVRAGEAMMEALGQQTARAGAAEAGRKQAISETASTELQEALDRGQADPASLIAAGLSSGALSAADAQVLAWNAARDEAGFADDEALDELDESEWLETVEAISEQQGQLVGEAEAMAEMEKSYVDAEKAGEQAFARQIETHKESVVALQRFKDELGVSAVEFDAHLREVDQALENGLMGERIDLDAVARSDPALFNGLVRSASAVLRQGAHEAEAGQVKAGIMGQERDIASGLVVGGVPVRPAQVMPFDEEAYADRVVARAQPKPDPADPAAWIGAGTTTPVDGYTSDGKRTHRDDLPLRDGKSAKQQLQDERRRGGRA